MTFQSSIEEFGYQDFALIRVPQDQVGAAVGRSFLNQTRRGPGPSAEAEQPSFWARAAAALGSETPTQPVEITMHVGADARPTELLTRDPQAIRPVDFLDDIRISQLNAASQWTLVEHVEQISGVSLLASELSSLLPDTDVLYFRRSGALATEMHHDFHIYRDGTTTRRVMCHSKWPDGNSEAEEWEAHMDGPMSSYEPEHLYRGTRDANALTQNKQAQILRRLGLSFEALFSPGAREDMILFSRRAGGFPLL